MPTPPKAGAAYKSSKLSKSTLTSASSLLLSSASTIKPNPPASPPRAPPLSKTHQTASAAITNYNAKSTSSTSLPMASQWQSGFNMPALAKAPSTLLPASLTGGTSALDQHAYEQHMAEQEDQHKSLPGAILKAPFTKRVDKSQHTLSQFVVRENEADTSVSSTSSKSSTSKRSLPWDISSTTSSKSAKTTIGKSTSTSSVTSAKGKGKVNIGTLNVQQQIVLSSEQQKVLKTVVEGGKNVFFTGSAGVLPLPHSFPSKLIKCVSRNR